MLSCCFSFCIACFCDLYIWILSVQSLLLCCKLTFLCSSLYFFCFFFSSRRRHTRFKCDWSSDVCSSDLPVLVRLFSRFGQNERSLFSFLLSNEPFGLQTFAQRSASSEVFYRITDLYDYAEIGRASCRERV